jgi:GNAT superfamily N-acetyltransferase
MNGRAPFPDLTARPIRADDAERLRRAFTRLSPDTIYRRFFSPVRAPSERTLRWLTEVDHRDREALVALEGDEIVAVARWDSTAPGGDEAELAVVVVDDWQRRGLGRALTSLLIDAARVRRLTTLTARVQADNRGALRLVAGTLGRPDDVRRDGPELSLAFRLIA